MLSLWGNATPRRVQLDFSAPALNRYAYQLQGYDADWVASDAEHRLAAYTNLPPGDYELGAVHEKMGEKTMHVTVPANGTAKADFSFAQ